MFLKTHLMRDENKESELISQIKINSKNIIEIDPIYIDKENIDNSKVPLDKVLKENKEEKKCVLSEKFNENTEGKFVRKASIIAHNRLMNAAEEEAEIDRILEEEEIFNQDFYGIKIKKKTLKNKSTPLVLLDVSDQQIKPEFQIIKKTECNRNFFYSEMKVNKKKKRSKRQKILEKNTIKNTGYKTVSPKHKSVIEISERPPIVHTDTVTKPVNKVVKFIEEPISNEPHNSDEIKSVLIKSKPHKTFKWEGEKEVVEIVNVINLCPNEKPNVDFEFYKVDGENETIFCVEETKEVESEDILKTFNQE